MSTINIYQANGLGVNATLEFDDAVYSSSKGIDGKKYIYPIDENCFNNQVIFWIKVMLNRLSKRYVGKNPEEARRNFGYAIYSLDEISEYFLSYSLEKNFKEREEED